MGSEERLPTPDPKGIVSGHLPGDRGPISERGASGLRRSFVDILAWLITVAWAASFIVDMLPYDYDPPASIHALMMIVASAAFGSNLLKRKNEEE